MANNLDVIVKCDISLEEAAATAESQSGLLLLAAGTESSTGEIQHFASITEVEEAGYESTSAVYLAAYTAFKQDPCPDGLYVMEVKSDEEPTDAVKRALDTSGWYFVLPVGIDVKKINALSVYVETTEKELCYTLPADTDSPVLTTDVYRTQEWKLASNQTGDYDPYLHVAVCARLSTYDPGSETWALKTLKLITAGVFTAAQVTAMDTANQNYFVEIAGKKITQGGKVLGGEWIDVIRFRDWLKNQIKVRVFELLVSNKKIPYTDAGITAIHGVVLSVLKQGQSMGGIPPLEYDEDGAEITPYSVTVPRAYQITREVRRTRKLSGIKFSARLAGAIHFVEITGSLTN